MHMPTKWLRQCESDWFSWSALVAGYARQVYVNEAKGEVW